MKWENLTRAPVAGTRFSGLPQGSLEGQQSLHKILTPADLIDQFLDLPFNHIALGNLRTFQNLSILFCKCILCCSGIKEILCLQLLACTLVCM